MQVPRETDTQLVIDYVMEHEPCLCSQVIEGLQMRPKAVRSILTRQKQKGLMRLAHNKKGRGSLWEMVPDYAEPPPAPIRPRVTTWIPHHHRHWLDVALFGPAPIHA